MAEGLGLLTRGVMACSVDPHTRFSDPVGVAEPMTRDGWTQPDPIW